MEPKVKDLSKVMILYYQDDGILIRILFRNGDISMDRNDWELLSYEEKKRQLFLHQKQTLDLFLMRGAISRAQYEKSLHDLTLKMGMENLTK